MLHRLIFFLLLLNIARSLPAADLSSHMTINTRIGPLHHVVRYAPTPNIPAEMFAQCPVGHGSFAIDLDARSGFADGVRVVKSTGCKAIDQMVMACLRQWRFQPHALLKVIVPVDFDYQKRN